MPETQNQTPIIKTTERPSSSHWGIFIFVLILVGLGIFIWSKYKLPNKTAQNPSSQNSQSTGTPGSIAGDFTATSSSPGFEPRGIDTPTSTQIIIAPPHKQTWTYENNNFNFAVTLPPNWIAATSSENTIGFFQQPKGNEIGYIEIYNNTAGIDLKNIEATLQNSPDVERINYGSLDDQPALEFFTTTQFKNGLAVIYKNWIYYLRGDIAKPEALANFKFK